MIRYPKSFVKCVFPVAAAAFALTITAPFASASYIVTFAPDGDGNVVATGSGTINTTAFTNDGFTSLPADVWPAFPGGSFEFTGPALPTAVEILTGLTGPANFGTGAQSLANSGSGDLVGIVADSGIYLPLDYVSGSSLSDTSTYTGATLASLGLTAGTYTYTWGTGATADSFEVVVGSSTPEPASLVLIGIPGVLLLLARRRKRV